MAGMSAGIHDMSLMKKTRHEKKHFKNGNSCFHFPVDRNVLGLPKLEISLLRKKYSFQLDGEGPLARRKRFSPLVMELSKPFIFRNQNQTEPRKVSFRDGSGALSSVTEFILFSRIRAGSGALSSVTETYIFLPLPQGHGFVFLPTFGTERNDLGHCPGLLRSFWPDFSTGCRTGSVERTQSAVLCIFLKTCLTCRTGAASPSVRILTRKNPGSDFPA